MNIPKSPPRRSPEVEAIAYSLAARVRKRPQRNGDDGYLTFCPAHANSKTPALSVRPGREHGIVWKCFGGCDQNKVRQALIDLGLYALHPLSLIVEERDHVHAVLDCANEVTGKIWRGRRSARNRAVAEYLIACARKANNLTIGISERTIQVALNLSLTSVNAALRDLTLQNAEGLDHHGFSIELVQRHGVMHAARYRIKVGSSKDAEVEHIHKVTRSDLCSRSDLSSHSFPSRTGYVRLLRAFHYRDEGFQRWQVFNLLRGHPRTSEEVREQMGWSSIQTARAYLRQLEDDGLVGRENNRQPWRIIREPEHDRSSRYEQRVSKERKRQREWTINVARFPFPGSVILTDVEIIGADFNSRAGHDRDYSVTKGDKRRIHIKYDRNGRTMTAWLPLGHVATQDQGAVMTWDDGDPTTIGAITTLFDVSILNTDDDSWAAFMRHVHATHTLVVSPWIARRLRLAGQIL
jgi:hypothetical protein